MIFHYEEDKPRELFWGCPRCGDCNVMELDTRLDDEDYAYCRSCKSKIVFRLTLAEADAEKRGAA